MGGTVAEIGLAADEFALAGTMERLDDVQFDIERIVASNSDHVMPYIWVESEQFDEIDAVLEADESVESVELLADLEGERLYQMDWVSRIETLVQILVQEDGTVLSAQGNSDGWTLRILVPERDALSRTYEYCRENEFSMDIHSIYNLDDGREGRFGLTDDQQDTLEAAFELGYYEIPRETLMDELAAEFDISHQALSERLRRAHGTLVENTIIIGRPEEHR
ncbi:helix-turn-helix domain-containing protein [Natrononativus amylolyticus]|uniref:helix-turn-helix domain-containing protein n=1 Tax=Natrononativus amylolyticus TaxID=2963434 RepID=UPI0020CB6D62|nr:helix-turn-helix domain-containing protein [Natrononativus amylolyticus]